MRPRDGSFPAFFLLVVCLHVALIGWLLFRPAGCQMPGQAAMASIATPSSVPEGFDSSQAISLDLTLADRVAAAAAEDLPPSDEDPPSRLVLPNQRETAKAERERLALLAQEKARREQAAREEREAAAKAKAAAEAKALAEKRAAEAAAEAEAERRQRELALERARKRKAEEEARQRALAEEQKKADAERQRILAEQQRRRQREAEAEAERQRVLAAEREAQRQREAEVERQRQVAEERRLQEERKRLLAEQLAARKRAEEEAQRKAEQAAARQRLMEQEERRRAAELAAATPPVEKARPIVPGNGVVRANVVEPGNGAGAPAPPNIVPARPRGGGSSERATADMASYRASVQRTINARWQTPKGLLVNQRPEVLVRIDRTGKVTFSRLARSSGNSALDRSAMDAVRVGSRLIPLPPAYPKDLYEVTVKFQID